MDMSIKREALRSTDFGNVATGRKLAPVHPGAVLFKDLVEPLGLTRYRVAKAMRVPQRRVDEICAGWRKVGPSSSSRTGFRCSRKPTRFS